MSAMKKWGYLLAIMTAVTCLLLLYMRQNSMLFYGQIRGYYQIWSRERCSQCEDNSSSFIPFRNSSAVDGKVKHFVFIKIEKTGSSSLYSTFGRPIILNQLNLLMPMHDHLSWRNSSGWFYGPRRNEPPDSLINHHTFNESAYQMYFPNDTKYIVSLRHPVNWFKSVVSYYPKYFPLIQGMNSVMNIYSWFHLVQLQFLGYDYRHPDRDNPDRIRQFIAEILPKIDVFILNEYFDASLVVLKRRFSWDYLDIVTRKSVVTGSSSKVQLSEPAIRQLLSSRANLGELMLYEAVNTTWWQQPELQQPDFWTEVEYFQKLNSQVNGHCSQKRDYQTALTLPANQWHSDLHVTTEYCDKSRHLTYNDDMKPYAKGLIISRQHTG